MTRAGMPPSHCMRLASMSTVPSALSLMMDLPSCLARAKQLSQTPKDVSKDRGAPQTWHLRMYIFLSLVRYRMMVSSVFDRSLSRRARSTSFPIRTENW